MKIHDISLTVTPGLPVWPGDPSVVLERMTKMEDGAHNNISRMAMGAHTGTHVDAPYHFIADGKTIESLALDTLTGPALVVEIPAECRLIGAAELKAAGIRQGMERILLKTANNRYWQTPAGTTVAGTVVPGTNVPGTTVPQLPFQKDFVAVSPDGAEYLVACGVRLVGIDYFSIAPFGDSVPTHRALLGAEVIVLEGINLSAIAPGKYQLYCLPIKLGGSDGAPARAILIEE